MKNWLIVVGVVLFLGGLVALFAGITALVAEPCFAGGDCAPNTGSNIVFFPIGLVGVILGAAAWSAGSGGLTGSTSGRNPLAIIGFFGIFGLSFLGIGIVMFVADQQPTTDHTTNVLTILGIIFGIVGIISIAVEIVSHVSSAADARILATGTHGRATVTAVRDTNVTVNMNPMVALDMKVAIPGQPVFTATTRKVISRLDVGSYRPGLILSVAADPAKPKSFVIDWENSPIGDTNAALDPVTGQPVTAQPSFGAVPGPTPGVGGLHATPTDVAAVLRAAADQIASGGLVSHPDVASAVSNAHQWTPTGQTLTPDQIATILRTAAANAGSGGQVSAADLATMLRNASAAAATAADAAEEAARAGSATGAVGPTGT